MGTFDSQFDLRQPWQVEDLKKAIRKVLTKKEKTTRQISEEVGCNHEQARRVLAQLWDEKIATPYGDRRARVWTKA